MANRNAAPFGADQGRTNRDAAPFGADLPAASGGGFMDSLTGGLGQAWDAGGDLIGGASSILGGIGGMGGLGIPSLSGSGGQSGVGPTGSGAGDSADSLSGGVYAPMNVGGANAGGGGGMNTLLIAAVVGMGAWLIASR